jgi:hypothetical protein
MWFERLMGGADAVTLRDGGVTPERRSCCELYVRWRAFALCGTSKAGLSSSKFSAWPDNHVPIQAELNSGRH